MNLYTKYVLYHIYKDGGDSFGDERMKACEYITEWDYNGFKMWEMHWTDSKAGTQDTRVTKHTLKPAIRLDRNRRPLTSFSLFWDRCSFSTLDQACAFSLRSKTLIWLELNNSSLKLEDAQCAGPGRCWIWLLLMSRDRKLQQNVNTVTAKLQELLQSTLRASWVAFSTLRAGCNFKTHIPYTKTYASVSTHVCLEVWGRGEGEAHLKGTQAKAKA